MKNQRSHNIQARQARPLSPKQRGYLSQLAKQAHAKLSSAGAIDEDFTAWRHAEARKATDGSTISEASRADFDALEQHFLALAGQSRKAYDRATGPDNDMRNMAHNIATAARQAGVSDAYIAAICRRMSGGTRDTWRDLKQGEAVLIALKNKARADQAKAATTTA